MDIYKKKKNSYYSDIGTASCLLDFHLFTLFVKSILKESNNFFFDINILFRNPCNLSNTLCILNIKTNLINRSNYDKLSRTIYIYLGWIRTRGFNIFIYLGWTRTRGFNISIYLGWTRTRRFNKSIYLGWSRTIYIYLGWTRTRGFNISIYLGWSRTRGFNRYIYISRLD